MAPIAPATKPLTKYAKKFGVLEPEIVNTFQLTDTYKVTKSFITPTRPLPRKASARRVLRRRNVDLFQSALHYDFSINELVALESLALGPPSSNPDVQQSDLNNAIHPIFSMGSWWTSSTDLSSPLYEIGDARTSTGLWEANNRFVWWALRPCLRLASRVLTQAHLWSMYDAMLSNNLSPIVVNGVEMGLKLTRRPAIIVLQDKDKMQKKLEGFAADVKFRLSHGYADEGFSRETLCLGTSGFNRYDDGVVIDITYSQVAKLLRQGASPAERLVDQWVVTNTILHELSHGLYRVLMLRNEAPVGREPFFEDEMINELGFSVMNEITCGFDLPIHRVARMGKGAATTMGSLARQWPLAEDDGYASSLTLAITPEMKIKHLFPVPLSWFSRVYSSSFWDYQIHRIGIEGAYYGPFVSGRISESSNLPDVVRPSVRRALVQMETTYGQQDYTLGQSLTKKQLIEIDVRNRRKVARLRIEDALGLWRVERRRGVDASTLPAATDQDADAIMSSDDDDITIRDANVELGYFQDLANYEEMSEDEAEELGSRVYNLVKWWFFTNWYELTLHEMAINHSLNVPPTIYDLDEKTSIPLCTMFRWLSRCVVPARGVALTCSTLRRYARRSHNDPTGYFYYDKSGGGQLWLRIRHPVTRPPRPRPFQLGGREALQEGSLLTFGKFMVGFRPQRTTALIQTFWIWEYHDSEQVRARFEAYIILVVSRGGAEGQDAIQLWSAMVQERNSGYPARALFRQLIERCHDMGIFWRFGPRGVLRILDIDLVKEQAWLVGNSEWSPGGRSAWQIVTMSELSGRATRSWPPVRFNLMLPPGGRGR